MRNVKPGHERPIVCLNAGHSGKVNRSPVVPEYYESEMTWKLTNYQAEELEKYGIKVIKTRDKQEVGMDLYARGQAAEGCDLWLSNHSNACDTESVDRPVVIPMVSDSRTQIDEQSQELAALLGQTIYEVMQTTGKPQIMSREAGRDIDGDGERNDEWYGELRGAHDVGVPGMILEHSFHTNTRATKWLQKDANLKKLAAAEAKTVAEWFGMTENQQDTTERTETQAPEAGEKQAEEKRPFYRIRRSWEDVSGQEGAYLNLENAIRACPVGYSVFDEDGEVLCANEPAEGKPDYAMSFDGQKAGSYEVTAQGGLNLRLGASTTKLVCQVLKNGEQVECYGFFTGQWLYVVSEQGTEGFCHSSYLKKV